MTLQGRRSTSQSNEYPGIWHSVTALPTPFEKFWLHPWIRKTNECTVDFAIPLWVVESGERDLAYKASLSLCMSIGISSKTSCDHVQSQREVTCLGRPHNVVKEWKKSEFLTMKAFHISHNSNRPGATKSSRIFFYSAGYTWFMLGKCLLLTWFQKWTWRWLSSIAACIISFSFRLRPFDNEGMGN